VAIYLELSVESRANEQRDLGRGQLVPDEGPVLSPVLVVKEQQRRTISCSHSHHEHRVRVAREHGQQLLISTATRELRDRHAISLTSDHSQSNNRTIKVYKRKIKASITRYRADLGVQAVSPQVTISHPPGGRLFNRHIWMQLVYLQFWCLRHNRTQIFKDKSSEP